MLKYGLPIALIVSTLGASFFLLPSLDECCEYLGLLSPEGVSEVPGVEHADIEEAEADGSIPSSVPGLKLHDHAGEIELPDIHGESRRIDFGAAGATVFVFVSSFCPTSKIYEERLNRLAADFRDVAFWAISSSAQEDLDRLRAHFDDGAPNRLKMTVLRDEDHLVADRWGGRVATDVFVFDPEGRLVYRGGIDDSRKPQEVETEYLRLALQDLTAGEEPRWRYQPSTGCCPIARNSEED